MKSGCFTLPVLARPANMLAPGIHGPGLLDKVRMLRVSLTDVCNFRCLYCMPESGVAWLGRDNHLPAEELVTIVAAAARIGISHFKLTGGEPTTRKDLVALVGVLSRLPGVADLSMTTNGLLLEPLLEPLRDAGLHRLTLSLDSLDPQRFAQITRGGNWRRVWGALQKALQCGFSAIKLNMVVMRGKNDDEVAAMARLTQSLPLTVRFIELMPLGESQAQSFAAELLVTEAETRTRIQDALGPLQAIDRSGETGVGPASIWKIPGAVGRVGFISAMSHPFCSTCNRLRLTPEGLLRSCLFDGGEIDLVPILRSPDSRSPEDRLIAAMEACLTLRPELHGPSGTRAMNQIGG